ncbi:MAG: creatininase family protein [Alphaproteobacteria bacterium]
MRLQLSTWQEVDAYLTRSKGIVVPVGSTEQHGPNGLIGTDAICPETVANGVAARLEVLVGPTLSIGMAQHHMAFAGTITFRPSTFMAVLKDVIGSLEAHGFERIYFLNGHGGNIATITAAFSEVYAERSLAGRAGALRCRLANWFGGRRVKEASRELYGASEGRHATPSEVSLSYYAHPEAVKQAQMSPKVAPVGDIRDALDYRRQFPDGRIGSDPSLASVEDGRRLFEAAVDDVAEDYAAFQAED